MEFLRSSSAVRKKLGQLFSRSTRGRRRVAMVAFVGRDAPRLLPDYKGVDLYCWPQVGSTDPNALVTLAGRKHGAKVRLVDGLHTKMYWVEGIGYVVTSANLTRNALGEAGLHEVGVFVPAPDQVDIDELIAGLDSRPARTSELRDLQRRHDLFWSANGRRVDGTVQNVESFRDWFDGPRLKGWKLGWFDATEAEAESSAARARKEYGVDDIQDYMDCRDGDYETGDWVLCFKLSDRRASLPSWLFAQFVNRLSAQEMKNGDSDYTHQAVQATRLSRHIAPPFDVTASSFRQALSLSITGPEILRLKRSSSVIPSARLLRRLRDQFS